MLRFNQYDNVERGAKNTKSNMHPGRLEPLLVQRLKHLFYLLQRELGAWHMPNVQIDVLVHAKHVPCRCAGSHGLSNHVGKPVLQTLCNSLPSRAKLHPCPYCASSLFK